MRVEIASKSSGLSISWLCRARCVCARQELADRAARLGTCDDCTTRSVYCFALWPNSVIEAMGTTMLPRRVAYLDAIDERTSNWCRFLNHANTGARECNLRSRCDGELVWFEATRDIAADEELCFDYGPGFRWVEGSFGCGG